MRLSAIHVYPIKSARGLSPARWPVDRFGFRWDRRWMLVDRNNRFVSQRERPRLALIEPVFGDDALLVRAPALEPIRLPLGAAPDADPVRVRIWADAVPALRVPDADAWFSEALAEEVRLVFLPGNGERRVHPGYAVTGDEPVAFADAFPFLIIGAASLDDLNTRLPAPLPMNRFRPNLVVEGAPPYAEDGWRRILAGAVELDVVKPCGRCAITTTDQRTAERSREPLRTLATYRRGPDGEVYFGQNAIHRGPGELAVGDAVEVLD